MVGGPSLIQPIIEPFVIIFYFKVCSGKDFFVVVDELADKWGWWTGVFRLHMDNYIMLYFYLKVISIHP